MSETEFSGIGEPEVGLSENAQLCHRMQERIALVPMPRGLEITEDETETRKSIFRSLAARPVSLVEEMEAHLLARDEEQAEYQSRHGGEIMVRDEGADVRGRLFEILVGEQIEPSDPEDPIAKQLLSLVQNPERYDMEEVIRKGKNPDFVRLHIDKRTGQYVVDGAIDAKLGLINSRVRDQLDRNGFERTLRTAADVVNGMVSGGRGALLVAVGLDKLGDSKKNIVIAESLRQTIYMPRQRKNQSIREIVNCDGQEHNAQGWNEEVAAFLEDEKTKNRINFSYSVFTSKEVGEMASVLLSEVRKKRAINRAVSAS